MKEQELVLTNCHTVDATMEAPVKDAAIWVKGERIKESGNANEVVDHAKKAGVTETLDLRGAYVTPGLINMHVHLCLALPGAEATRLATENDAELALRIASNARKALHAGATSLRLVSEKRHADLALRRAITRGEAQGPRLFTAGTAISCTGGHGRGAGATEADGPAEFRKVARAQLKAGADFIKVMISGGISGEFEGKMDSQVAPDELRAVTEVAHGWDKKVTAHVGPAHVIKMGIECGLDCIEHGYELNEEVVKLMVKHGTWLVPTILVTRCKEFYDRIKAPPWMVERALGKGPAHMAGLKLAIESGVDVALGTDMLPAEPFEGTTATVRELEYLVEAGMTTRQALRAATVKPAEWLRVDDQLATIESGKFADLVGIDGDPLQDISSYRKLRFVMKGGEVVRNDAPGA